MRRTINGTNMIFSNSSIFLHRIKQFTIFIHCRAFFGANDSINYSLCVFKQIHLFASKKQKKPAAYQPTQIIYALCAKAYAASPIDNTASLENTSCKSLDAIACNTSITFKLVNITII